MFVRLGAVVGVGHALNRPERSLVADRGHIGPDVTVYVGGHIAEAHVGAERFVADMHVEDDAAYSDIRDGNLDAGLQPTGSGKRGTERVPTVRYREGDEIRVAGGVVYFHQELRDDTLGNVRVRAGAITVGSDGVYLVEKGDT